MKRRIMENIDGKEVVKMVPVGSVGFTCSCFDLLHAGHVLMLKDAKQQCDYLVVALQSDPTLNLKYSMNTGGKQKNKPIQISSTILILAYSVYELVQNNIVSKGWGFFLFFVVIFNILWLMVRYAFIKKN